MNYLSLFSGIGGFEYGIQQSRYANQLKCIGYSEIDKYAENVYKKHYPNHTKLGDATQIQPKKLQNFDLLVGGFPCQAFSHAGKRRGFDDTRGTLFFEIARILKTKKPKYFLLENVKGLLSHDKGRTFQTMLRVLADLGYDVLWEIFNSKNFGVPQNRERVYIKGFLRNRCGTEILSIRRTSKKTNENQLLKLNNKSQAQSIYSIEGVSTTLMANGGGDGGKTGLYDVSKINILNRHDSSNQKEYIYDPHGITGALCATDYKDPIKILIKDNTQKGYSEANIGDAIQLQQKGSNGKKTHKQITPTIDTSNSIGVVTHEHKIRRLTPIECERLQGFPDNWTKIGADGNTLSNTQRYKMCGNAVTTTVITHILNTWDMKLED